MLGLKIHLRPLTNALGAEVTGIDLSEDIQPPVIEEIVAAWKQYRLLVFPEQAIGDAEHARFARYFGKLEVFTNIADRTNNVVETYRASNTDERGHILPSGHEKANLLRMNWFWHADGCYKTMPNKGVILRGLEVVEDGGDTVFANMEAAFMELPTATKCRLTNLVARHSFAHMVTYCGLPPLTPLESLKLPSVNHPLIWHHADGHKSLFLSPPYIEKIIGLNPANSEELVDELTEWSTQDRFLYQHHWRPNDVLIWDNHFTMHRVLPYDLTCNKRVAWLHIVRHRICSRSIWFVVQMDNKQLYLR